MKVNELIGLLKIVKVIEADNSLQPCDTLENLCEKLKIKNFEFLQGKKDGIYPTLRHAAYYLLKQSGLSNEQIAKITKAESPAIRYGIKQIEDYLRMYEHKLR